MDYTTIIVSFIASLGILIPALLLHFREVGKHKLELLKLNRELDLKISENRKNELKIDFFNRAMDLTSINPIIDAVDRIFKSTKADRFLILIAINGKENFNIVSVIFEQHKNDKYKVNAIGTYRNIGIDNAYREMLKKSEFLDCVDLETATMTNGILKEFYEMEGVKFSKIKFLSRQKIDSENDFVIYSSIATHTNNAFNKRENTIIKTNYENTIIPKINKVLT